MKSAAISLYGVPVATLRSGLLGIAVQSHVADICVRDGDLRLGIRVGDIPRDEHRRQFTRGNADVLPKVKINADAMAANVPARPERVRGNSRMGLMVVEPCRTTLAARAS